jgi:hypothetical protein
MRHCCRVSPPKSRTALAGLVALGLLCVASCNSGQGGANDEHAAPAAARARLRAQFQPGSARALPPELVPKPADFAADYGTLAVEELLRRRPELVVDGVVETAAAQLLATGDANESQIIGTKYTLRVLTAWSSDPGPEVEFWVRGGQLDDKYASSGYPRKGEYTSSEVYPKVGERLLIGLKKQELVPTLTCLRHVRTLPVYAPAKNVAAKDGGAAADELQQLIAQATLTALDRQFTVKVTY